MSNRNEELKQEAAAAAKNKKELSALVAQLSDSSRRQRQHAASVIRIVATMEPERLSGHIDDIGDALGRPEAQTRWECLETMALLIDVDSRACGKIMEEAETALFDEDSGPVRLAAVRFLCKYGATTATRSDKVWPLIDEAIQCYHGDLEFNDMLSAITEFSNGKLSTDVKASLKDRMSFDAESGKGSLKRRAQQIVDNLG